MRRFSVRAPGGALGGSGTGVPGTSGGGAPGRPAIGIPGVGGRPFGFGGDVCTSTGAGKPPPNGPTPTPAHGSGFQGRGGASGAGVYEHAVPGGTAGPGWSGVPSDTGGAGGGAPLGNRVPLGSGQRNSGRPALRQKFSGSIPRCLKAASTNGCKIQYGSRLDRTILKYGPDATDSPNDAANWLTYVRVWARSSLRATSTSVRACNCSSTGFRFGLSLMNPCTWAEKAEIFCSRAAMARPRSLNAASSVFALTSNRLICSLRSPSTLATWWACASRCLIASSR